MTERAAHLVDAVVPWVPVRQWVLTVPYRLRYQMAWNHGLSRAVLRVYTRVLLDVYARGARECGVRGTIWPTRVLPDNLGYLFDTALALTPSRPAVFQGDTVLTYAELDARSNRMAVAAASGAASVRVWEVMSRGRGHEWVPAAGGR